MSPDLHKTWRIYAPGTDLGIPVVRLTILTVFISWWVSKTAAWDKQAYEGGDRVAMALVTMLSLAGGFALGQLLIGWWRHYDLRDEVRELDEHAEQQAKALLSVINIAERSIDEKRDLEHQIRKLKKIHEQEIEQRVLDSFVKED